MSLSGRVREYTEQLNQKGLLRTRRITDSYNSPLIHFDSNDYLSLTQDKRIAQAYQQGYALYPVGSGASMVLSGYHPNHRALERAFSEHLGVDECILFSSGYAANLAITALLGSIKAHCLIDKSVHASVYDGLALSQVHYTRYRHNDMTDLANKLTSISDPTALLTEGIFSMSGQVAPLAEISSLCSTTIVDEAHSFGVIGAQGKGAVHYHGLGQKEVPLRILAFGKAFAAQGALIAGQKEWINALLQAGRSVIYSTGISPALSYGLLKTLDLVIDADDRRVKLGQLIQLFKEEIINSPLNWVHSDTPIQQLQLGCPHKAQYYDQELQQLGFSCSAIRAPTVNVKATGLRLIINYRHEPKQIQQLFEQLHTIYERTN